jgi:hypothetical protein
MQNTLDGIKREEIKWLGLNKKSASLMNQTGAFFC